MSHHDEAMAIEQGILSAEEMTVLAAFENLTGVAHGIAKAKGFWDNAPDPAKTSASPERAKQDAQVLVEHKLSKLALMMSELGECVEGIRKPGPDQHLPEFSQEEVELADCIIRIFDYAGRFDIQLGAALLAKMRYNMSRPYKHGKKA